MSDYQQILYKISQARKWALLCIAVKAMKRSAWRKRTCWELNGTMDKMNITHLIVSPAHLEINPMDYSWKLLFRISHFHVGNQIKSVSNGIRVSLNLQFCYNCISGWIKSKSVCSMTKQRNHSEENAHWRIICKPSTCGMCYWCSSYLRCMAS